MEEKTFWENKVFLGKGNLQKFSQDYELIAIGKGQFATASQLFPTGKNVGGDAEFQMEFEYVIYYKKEPAKPVIKEQELVF